MKRLYYRLILVITFLLVAGNIPAVAEGVDIHGFISQGYLKTDQNNYLAETDDGSFQFNEMGINFTTFATSKLKVGCQFFARDIGDVGNDEIYINWAFAEYTYKNWLRMRAGILKQAFSFYNPIRDFDSLRTSIFLPSATYNEWLRDGFDKMKGVELFGSLNLGSMGMLEYRFQAGVAPISLDSGTAKYLTNISSSNLKTLTAANSDANYCGQFIWNTPLEGFRAGVSYIYTSLSYEGTIDIDLANYGRPGIVLTDIPISIDVTSDVYMFSLEYIFNNLKISFENYWTIGESKSLTSLDPNPSKRDNDSKKPYYISVGYRFNDWFEAAYYYSDYEGDDDSAGDANELVDHCLSLRFDINYNWIAKLEAHVMEGEFGVSADDDGHRYSEWMLFAAKLSYAF